LLCLNKKELAMNFSSSKEPYDGYCGTSYAAKLLGVSVGTVQGLVEKNDLKAWKTQGGHRRISMQSIQEYQRRHNLSPASLTQGEDRLRVLVVEDDEATRVMLQSNFDQWGLPLDAIMYSSAMEALLDMPTMQPQVLLTDLRMPNVDGFEFLRTLSEHTIFNSLAVVVITGMSPDEISAKGGLPDGVQLLQKPIDLDWLRGFLDALMSVRQINRRARAQTA
jgi:excisionase family DNA binding protein